MSDISLLQREYDVVKEESRLPGIVFTAALIFLLLIAGAWVSLYFYHKFYVEHGEDIKKRIEELKLEEAGKSLDKLKVFSNKAEVLSALRQAHTSAISALKEVEKSTHPLVWFENGNVNLSSGEIELKGRAPSALVLARQVEIYTENKNLGEFKVGNIAYQNERSVAFGANLKFKKE